MGLGVVSKLLSLSKQYTQMTLRFRRGTILTSFTCVRRLPDASASVHLPCRMGTRAYFFYLLFQCFINRAAIIPIITIRLVDKLY